MATAVICSFIENDDYYAKNGYYFLIIMLVLYITLLGYCIKFPFDIPVEKIERKLAKLDFQLRQKKSQRKNLLNRQSKKSRIRKNSSKNNNNSNKYVPFYLNDIEENVLSFDSENEEELEKNRIVQKHPQLYNSQCESARFNQLDNSSNYRISESFQEDINLLLIPQKICVAGWDYDIEKNDNYFIIETEQGGEINYAKRFPKEFRALFKSLIKTNRNFKKPYKMCQNIKVDFSIERLEQIRNILNSYLEMLVSKQIMCLNFREFLLPPERLKVYQGNRMMSFGHNDFFKLSNLGNDFIDSFEKPSNQPLPLKNSVQVNYVNNELMVSLMSNSQSMSAYSPTSSIFTNTNDKTYSNGQFSIQYNYIIVTDFEKTITPNGKIKYLYNIQFSNSYLKINYTTQRSYVDFCMINKYLQEIYRYQNLNYTQLTIQDLSKSIVQQDLKMSQIQPGDEEHEMAQAISRLKMLNYFCEHITKYKLWSLNLHTFLEQNKIINTKFQYNGEKVSTYASQPSLLSVAANSIQQQNSYSNQSHSSKCFRQYSNGSEFSFK